MAITVGTDTYVTVAEADTYLAQALHAGTTWSGAGTPTKEQALVTATRMLERQTWVGTRAPLPPGPWLLDWPRSGVTDPDGNTVASDSVPTFIEDAECELALALLVDSSVQTSESSGSNIAALGAGSARIEYFRPTAGGRFPTIIQELIGFYLAGKAGGVSSPYFGPAYESGVSETKLLEGL